MVKLDAIQKRLIEEIADLHSVPEGAYNFRANSQLAGRNTTANIDIVSKEDGSGIDIHIKPGTKNESVHIPVVLSQSGIKETVYNDFYVGEDSDVVIVAGCGIDNSRTPSTTAFTDSMSGRMPRSSTWKNTTAPATERARES